MWIAFGLVCLALYFGHSMGHSLRAADNTIAQTEADQAIEGAARYISFVLSNNPGHMPDLRDYYSENVKVGAAHFWLIGRSYNLSASSGQTPSFGLTDECSKFNINLCTLSNLTYLPRMDSTLAGSIMNWRDSSSSTNGQTASDSAVQATYSSFNPPYSLKGADFETLGELPLISGMTYEILYGRDQNLNGVVDPNEKNLQVINGYDLNGVLVDSGILEYLTVYGSDPNLQTNGDARVSVTSSSTNLTSLLSYYISDANLIKALTNFNSSGGGTTTTPTSLLQWYVMHINDGFTESDFEKLYDYVTISNGVQKGMINVNTASRVVLEMLDGMTSDMVDTLINYRQSNPDRIYSVAWVATALKITSTNNLPVCHTNLTTHTYQISADIAAVGHNNRGYRRVRYVFDTSTGVPQIVYRRDLTHLGWALGADLRKDFLYAKETR